MTTDRLHAFAREGQDLTAALLVRDPALVEAVQRRLIHHGLLDPPTDRFLGPVAQWALREFCRAARTRFEGGLTPEAARALLAEELALPLSPGDDLAGRIARALQRRGDPFCRHRDCVTVVYVEGMDEDGRLVPRRPDAFDDLRVALRIEGGVPRLAGAWSATTRPGRPAVETPAEPQGAPSLPRGWHRAWAIGRTAIGTELEQEALVQVVPLRVARDATRDHRRAGDPQEEGLFILDQHGAMDAPRDRVGGTGAGCLVGRAQDGHAAFMALLRGDARWRANSAQLFGTSVIGGEEL